MDNKKITKSSILSQLVGFTFIGTFASIYDTGLTQISLIFLFSFTNKKNPLTNKRVF